MSSQVEETFLRIYGQLLIIFERSIKPKYKDLKDFLEKNQKPANITRCQAIWDKPVLTAQCKKCGGADNACICLQCFLKSNHRGHQVYIHFSKGGTCDCGDILVWDKAGACNLHNRDEHDPLGAEFDEETKKENYIRYMVFAKVLLESIKEKDLDTFIVTCKFLEQFITLSDGHRRLVAMVLCDSGLIEAIISNSVFLPTVVIDAIDDTIRKLLSDTYFINTFTDIIYDNLEDAIDYITEYKKPVDSFIKTYNASYYAFMPPQIKRKLNSGYSAYVPYPSLLIYQMIKDLNNDKGLLVHTINRFMGVLREAGKIPEQATNMQIVFQSVIHTTKSVDAHYSFTLKDKIDYRTLDSLYLLGRECTEIFVTCPKGLDQSSAITTFQRNAMRTEIKGGILNGEKFPLVMPMHVAMAVTDAQLDYAKDVKEVVLWFAAVYSYYTNLPNTKHDSFGPFFDRHFGWISKYHPSTALFKYLQKACFETNEVAELIFKAFDIEGNPYRSTKFRHAKGYAYFIATILTDRIAFERDINAANKAMIISKLAKSHQPYKELWRHSDEDAERLEEVLKEVGVLVEDTPNTYKLKDYKSINPFHPIFLPDDMEAQLVTLLKAHTRSLIPFPPIFCDTFLSSKLVIASLYYVLALAKNESENIPVIHTITNIFLCLPEAPDPPVFLNVRTIRELSQCIPMTRPALITSSITIDSKELQLARLYGDMGPTGEDILERFGLFTRYDLGNPEAQAIKERLTNEYLQKQSKIQAGQDEPECALCHMNFAYSEPFKRGIIFKLRDFNYGYTETFAIITFDDPYHIECISKPDFKLGSPNSFNILIPDFDCVEPTPGVLQFVYDLEEKGIDFEQVLNSLSYLLTTTIIAMNHGLVLSPSLSARIKMMFNLSTHALNATNPPPPQRLNPLSSHIYQTLIESAPTMPHGALPLASIDLLEACIEGRQFKFDPDKYRGKSTRGVSIVPRQPFMQLPDRFVDLCLDPYKYEIDSDVSSYLDLITKEKVPIKEERDFTEYMKGKEGLRFTLLLGLTGNVAASLKLVSFEFGKHFRLPPIYRDEYGNGDYGYENGFLLYLCKNTYNEYIYALLTGDWIKYCKEKK